MASSDDLEFVLAHHLPKSTRWWLSRLLAVGQASGSDLVQSDLDMPVADNVASADRVLGALEVAGLIARGGWYPGHSTRAFVGLERRRPGTPTYPREWVWVPAARERIRQIVDRETR